MLSQWLPDASLRGASGGQALWHAKTSLAKLDEKAADAARAFVSRMGSAGGLLWLHEKP